jgi:VWFA-related protein
MRIALAIFSVALPVFVAAQTSQPLTEKIEVNVVNVDVTVLDRHRNPAHGLTAADFEIFEDGKPQKITNFYVIEAAVPHVEGSAAPGAAVVEKRFRRKAILLVDNIFIDKPRRDRALAQVQRFMESRFAGDYEWAIGTIGSGIHAILPFTMDKSKLADAIDRLRRSGTLSYHDEVDRGILADETTVRNLAGQNAQQQAMAEFQRNIAAQEGLTALSELAKELIDACHAYSNSDGKKLIVLVTGAIEADNRSPLQTDAQNEPSWMQQPRENTREAGHILETMVREANAANFNVYIVNAAGLVSPAPIDAGAHGSPYMAAGGFNSSHTEHDYDSFPVALGSETGGAYLPSNDLAGSLRQVDAESANYYSLGYSPSHFEDGKYHAINVHVKQPGLTVRHRAGYADLSTEQRTEDALRVSVDPSALPNQIPVELQIGSVRKENQKLLLPITVVAPMKSIALVPRNDRNVGRVHIYLAVFDQAGKNVGFEHRTEDLALTAAELEKVTQLGSKFRYFLKLGVKPGTYLVVAAVRDDVTNEIGSALQNVSF